jgi:predicted transcriptional regulator
MKSYKCPSRIVQLGLNTRVSRFNEILWFLFRYGGKEGLTWRQMVGEHFSFDGQVLQKECCFPRQTLDRHLKKLVKDGAVEKVKEPREQHNRGRPSWRYRIKHWHSWGCMHVRLPASRPAGPYSVRAHPGWWFLGTKFERLGTEQVRKWPEEKAQFDRLFREDASFRAAVLKVRRNRRKSTQQKGLDLPCV